MMRSTISIAAALGLLICFGRPHVFANSAADLINDFGLVGTWATNCAAVPGRANVDRYTFASQPPGLTKAASLMGGYRVVTSTFDIQAAQNLGNDKIKLTMLTKTVESSRPNENTVANPKVLEQIIQRTGAQIRIIDSRNADGTKVFIENGTFCPSGTLNGSSCEKSLTPILERCAEPN
jgi:hypothetical protein